MKIVLDCANGAASKLAPQLFRSLGANVMAINDSPDGRNINAGCGSLHPEKLQKTVAEQGAALGVAFDGDADRAIFASASGKLVDGDGVLLVAGRYLKSTGKLKGNVIVGTTMANLGLERALAKSGLTLARTAVGDRYVLEEMLRIGANLGGEQSGHILFLDDATTGDGMLTAVKMASLVSLAGTVGRAGGGFEDFPAEDRQCTRAVEAVARFLARDFPSAAASRKDARQFRPGGPAIFRHRTSGARDGGSGARRGCLAVDGISGLRAAIFDRLKLLAPGDSKVSFQRM